MIRLKRIFAACLGAILSGTISVSAQDVAFPTKPVTLVVPYAAGGTIDLQGRVVADGLSKKWGQPVIVENRPGAGGMVGVGYVARRKPDGHTLVYIGNPVASARLISRAVDFDPLTDLAPVINVGTSPLWLLGPPTKGVDNVDDFIKFSKEATSKQFYAALTGTALELDQIDFFRRAGISLSPVYYQGATEAFTALMTNQVQSFLASAVAASPLVDAGKIKLLGVGSAGRIKSRPNVPAIAESVPGYVSEQWFGIFTSGGTDPKLLAKLHADINAVIHEPAALSKFESFGINIVGSTPEETLALMKRDYEAVKAKIEELGWQPK